MKSETYLLDKKYEKWTIILELNKYNPTLPFHISI